jgi:hypothetical protein
MLSVETIYRLKLTGYKYIIEIYKIVFFQGKEAAWVNVSVLEILLVKQYILYEVINLNNFQYGD